MAHRPHCPFVCGFPRDGARKTTPIWKIVAEKLLKNYEAAKEAKTTEETNQTEEDGDAATDRIMKLLQCGVSSRGRKKRDNTSLLSL